MEFRQFKYVLKVAEERNFSVAAKKLYISQPSLSQFIQKVEEKVGALLFDRSVSPLKLTYIGSLYVETAQAIMDLQHQFEQKVDDTLNVRQGRVTIGSSPFRSAYLLSRVLPHFRRQYPNIEVFLQEDNTHNLEDRVLNGLTDLSLSLLPINEALFDYDILFEERMLLALPPNHPIAAQLKLKAGDHAYTPTIELSELQDTPFIQMNKGHKLHHMLQKLCENAGFSPNVVLETESMTTAQALAGAGIGAALLPETLVYADHFEKEPCYCRPDSKPSRTVVVVYRKDRYLSHATRAFIQTLKDYVTDNPN
ncbi:LysR family transcriptional regulator [Testudinibacter sp. TR-2022]|uniref:LysR family transcriptional regulator n=1 Tax=Testudinibacter sp. TR-2022 TaxID=2585029 RepID=UPI00111B3E47|nr:LysR family transcriptional regulator [Testudinibacter sp. TR-2022]TNH06911.1 LysR family transcriptional regulator [Pasteurellaceae bacterium Phil11]TNH21401.1 LysR family transcriptional regulator [Testudinibacter sp. TR-2022]TNH28849.1 LysR family transcriptional regulator [Testudinibacter sp. TR-2022]